MRSSWGVLMLWLVFWIVLATVLCGVCSLLEATFLSVRLPSLYELSGEGNAGAATLLAVRRSRPADAISSILLINTLAGMVGATYAGAAASELWGPQSVVWVSLTMTVVLLFAAEIGPKTFAASHSEQMADWTGRVLGVLLGAMSPLLPMMRAFTGLLSGGNDAMTRRGLASMIAAGPSEGTLTQPESELLGQIVYANAITLRDVHTPLSHVVTLPEEMTARDLLVQEPAEGFSRLPLYRRDRSNIDGYVSQREVLRHLALGKNPLLPLSAFRHDLPRLAIALGVQEAILALLDGREAIGEVIDEAEHVIGIVTLEDLLEALTGIAITDEAKEISALRAAGEQRRQERLATLAERRRQWSASRRAEPVDKKSES